MKVTYEQTGVKDAIIRLNGSTVRALNFELKHEFDCMPEVTMTFYPDEIEVQLGNGDYKKNKRGQ